LLFWTTYCDFKCQKLWYFVDNKIEELRTFQFVWMWMFFKLKFNSIKWNFVFFSFPIFVVLRYGDNSQANRNFESKTFLSFFKVIVVYKWNLYLIFCWVKRRQETTLHDIIPNNISNPKNIERATIPQKL
jgi:hypothetical protein